MALVEAAVDRALNVRGRPFTEDGESLVQRVGSKIYLGGDRLHTAILYAYGTAQTGMGALMD